MTPDDHLLLRGRNSYRYPWVYLRRLYAGAIPDGGVPVGDGREREGSWEVRHRVLLTSQSPERAALGLASVAYWGFYGSSIPGRLPTPGRALVRAKWVRDGGRRRAFTFRQMRSALQNASAELAKSEIANAMIAINTIPEFGQLSFGSKVLMAMSPDTC